MREVVENEQSFHWRRCVKRAPTAQSIDSDEKKLFYLRFSMDSAGVAELWSVKDAV
jgi:hypothetical protein